ncbi:MAG: chemotaxis response regulator protein-glutamate methylesterase [Candidatus Competibacteraceae bacterium]|nr:chemotaxis response regulator protein-glutamate methylesterase [Candidatus Competibacteraceae bacterium]MBK7985219.1 chemotaxis response regulator protein-glutamate methylesterase [Candidatus Competibacteraceae bacterium]MBK8895705.1 chemotaxis response regulator protein-glutamate methylesterase [Candidatus Competibacteraceae bacterium]MBK8962797.1 chemotaxis response regulator protein-glutamate methylesterase [Candidatus Competibacteraceae bacterium]MBK9953271.1 chemotaxis response regulato
MADRIKVLIIDDSALVRQMLTEMLARDSGIEVVGSATDPYMAREKIKKLDPDVLTLDVEMPRMDGLTFLSNLMRLRPMPVVMVSSLTESGAAVTLQALELGAIDFVTKPKVDLAHTLDDYALEIREKIRIAAGARVQERRPPPAANQPMRVVEKYSADVILQREGQRRPFKTTESIIAIGASTGGTEAIKEVLIRMPLNCPGIVITQHIPEAFSGPFARRMDSVSAIAVCEAADGQQVFPGHAYIAPGDRHLMLVRDGARYMCRLNDGPPVNRHRPSVDVLFRSVAANAGQNAVGVILTGMGDDGARGLKEMREAGAPTIAQDEQTSVVWGMPGQAVKLGGVDKILPLEAVAGQMLRFAEEHAR